MQFSLRTIMLLTAGVALLLVIPSFLGQLLVSILWYSIPTVLIAFAWPANSWKQAFARSSLACYIAMTVDKSDSAFRYLPFGTGVVLQLGLPFLAGWMGVRYWRHSIQHPSAEQRL